MRGKFAWGVREFGLGIEKFAVYIIKTRKKSVKKNQYKKHFHFNPFRPDPGHWEKVNSSFYFHTSLWCLKRFYEGL